MRSKCDAVARERENRSTALFFSALLVGSFLFAMSTVFAAVGGESASGRQAENVDEIITGSVPGGVAQSTNVRMQFFQEDGPRAGHVKIILTPDDRPLSMDEARSAARQAFLETLNDPFFMDGLKIVTVVVHRFPGQDEPVLDLHVQFRSQGDSSWSIQQVEQ